MDGHVRAYEERHLRGDLKSCGTIFAGACHLRVVVKILREGG